jgi:hypothetical protein
VVVSPIYQDDLGIAASKGSRGSDPRKTSPYDHDALLLGARRVCNRQGFSRLDIVQHCTHGITLNVSARLWGAVRATG